jgi:hypothetical protein
MAVFHGNVVATLLIHYSHATYLEHGELGAELLDWEEEKAINI